VHDPLAIALELRLDPEHDRDVGPVDIPVYQSDPATVQGERHREVDGDRRLAAAILSGAHRNDVLDARNRCSTSLWGKCRAHARGHRHVDRRDTAQCRDDRVSLIPHLILYRTRRRRELNRERHLVVINNFLP